MSDWTLTWNGLSVGGAANPYQLVELVGLHENPDVRTADQDRSRTHGQWASPDLLGGRTIQATIDVAATHPNESVWQAFSQAFVMGQATESALTLQIPGVARGTSIQANARVRRLALPVDRSYSLGLATAVVEFHCTDPRIYSSSLTSLSTTQAVSGGGLTFPAVAPLAFAGVASGGLVTATNAGEFGAPWTATISGPVTDPRIENVSTGQTVAFVGTVASGQTLVVSSLNRTVLLNGTTSRYSWLVGSSQWFDLAAGDNTIRFAGTSGTGSMTFNFRSVWI